MIDLGKTKKGYALNVVYSKEVWNAAIEECIRLAFGRKELIQEMEKLKK